MLMASLDLAEAMNLRYATSPSVASTATIASTVINSISVNPRFSQRRSVESGVVEAGSIELGLGLGADRVQLPSQYGGASRDLNFHAEKTPKDRKGAAKRHRGRPFI